MTTVLLVMGFLALFFVLMCVRLILVKDGEFKGTCASQSPFLNKEGATCGYCGKQVGKDTQCTNNESEVNKVLAKFE